MHQAKRQRRIERLLLASAMGAVCAAITIVVYERNELRDGGVIIVPKIEWKDRIWPAVPIGAIAFIASYIGLSHTKRTMICLKCGLAMTDDGRNECRCGGKTADLQTLRWVPVQRPIGILKKMKSPNKGLVRTGAPRTVRQPAQP